MDKLITIQHYADPVTANVELERLRVAEIPAFLANEATAGWTWHWTPASGGVGLQVPESWTEQALLLLGASQDPASAAEFAAEVAASGAELVEEGPEPARDTRARRSFRALVMGLEFFPLWIYATILSLVNLGNAGPISRKSLVLSVAVLLVGLGGLVLVFKGVQLWTRHIQETMVSYR